MLGKKADREIVTNGMSVHIIGNENAALIVSDRGHFDFRVNKKTVFGKIFDPKNRSFTGKSPTFVIAIASREKKVNFRYERVESTAGSISLVSPKITICFTVDTEKKELLAKVISSGAQKEYILCVSGQRIAVNSYCFDKICEKLARSTRYNRFRHHIYTEDNDAQKLYLFACFWDIYADARLTNFWSVQDLKRLVSGKRTLCISLPGSFSDKALSFVKSMICYSKYLKNVFDIGIDLALYDPKDEFSRFFEQNKLKKYTKEEFELLCVCSCGIVELALDFDSKVILNDLILKTLDVEENTDDECITDNEKIADLKMGILKATLGTKTVEKVTFSFKDRAVLSIHSLGFFIKNTPETFDISPNMILQGVYGNAVKYCYYYDGFEGDLVVGTDKSLPYLLMYAEKTRPDLDFSLKFSLRSAGVEISSKMIRINNTCFATVFTPMIYEKEKISLFIIKNQDESGNSIVMGAFSGDKDALLYKAMEKYPDTRSVRAELDRSKVTNEDHAREISCELTCTAEDDPCRRIQRAIAVCQIDYKKARSHIVWALCSQNIDGSLLCEGSAAKALAIYLEKSRDKEILYLELPYTCDGRYTSRKENVFMHVMRAAEATHNTEDENALEYLRKIYYEVD